MKVTQPLIISIVLSVLYCSTAYTAPVIREHMHVCIINQSSQTLYAQFNNNPTTYAANTETLARFPNTNSVAVKFSAQPNGPWKNFTWNTNPPPGSNTTFITITATDNTTGSTSTPEISTTYGTEQFSDNQTCVNQLDMRKVIQQMKSATLIEDQF